MYDSAGHRVKRTTGGVVTWYIYDGDTMIAQKSETGYTEYEIPGVGWVSPSGAGYSTTYTLTNQRGDTVGLAVGSQLTNIRDYDAYGGFYTLLANSDSDHRYVGGKGVIWNNASQTYTMGLRDYSPYLGRFLNQDPIGYKGGLNLYAYCGNEPVMGVDPGGTQSFDSIKATINEAVRRAATDPAGAFRMMRDLAGTIGAAGTNRINQYMQAGYQKILQPVTQTGESSRRFLHTLKHAFDFFSESPLTETKLNTWQQMIQKTTERGAMFFTKIGDKDALGFLSKFGERYFVAKYYTEGNLIGQLATFYEEKSPVVIRSLHQAISNFFSEQ